MNIVIGDRLQLSPNVSAQYITEPCGTRSFVGNNPLPCEKTDNITDQLIEEIRCGSFALDVKRCAKPDPLQCEIGLSSKNESPVTSVTWLGRSPQIRCFYDSTKIDTINQLQNYKTLFGDTDDYKKLATQFCLNGLSQKCSKGNQCSKFRSVDDEGIFCRTFYNTQSLAAQESLGQNVCFANAQLPECSCYTRASDENYKKLSLSAPFKDSCWYIPCRDSFSNLIPSDLRDPVCPTNVCQFILDAANNKNVNISDINSTIDCKFSPNPPNPQPGPQPGPPPQIQKASIIIPSIIILATAVAIGISIYPFKKNEEI